MTLIEFDARTGLRRRPKSLPHADKSVILCTEDLLLAEDLTGAFQETGITVSRLASMPCLAESVLINSPIALIMDRMIDGYHSFQVAEILRLKGNKTPIIIISALRSKEDIDACLSLGVDEVLVKPIPPSEVVDAVKFIMVRNNAENWRLTVGHTELNLAERTVTRGGRLLNLTDHQFDLLYIFMKNPDLLLSREFLLDQAWAGKKLPQDDKAVNQVIFKLRRTINENVILDIRKKGFVFQSLYA